MRHLLTFLFLSLLFSLNVAAQEEVCEPDDSPSANNVNSLAAITSQLKLDWWAASPNQVWNAPCKSHKPPSEEIMLSYIQGTSLQKKSEVINGIAFKDESPQLLKLFRDLNTYDYSKGGTPPLNFKSKCDKVLCAVKEIFGKKEGVQLLYLLKRYGFNGSALRTSHSSSWKASELEDVLTALGDYPDSLYPIEYNRKLTHFTRGMVYANSSEGVIANSVMEVFDRWSTLSQPERQQTFLHELGHVISQQHDLDSSAEWYKISGWSEQKTVNQGKTSVEYSHSDENNFVSKYGKTNPAEDFAETVVAYRFNGPELKKSHPARYKFIQDKVFDGKEYLSASGCKTSLSRVEAQKKLNNEAFAKVMTYIKSRPLENLNSSEKIRVARDQCLDIMMQTLANELSGSESCTTKSLIGSQLSAAAKAVGVSLDPQLLNDDQLSQVDIPEGAARAFNQMVRIDFVDGLTKDLTLSKYTKFVAKLSQCENWAFWAENGLQKSDLGKQLVSKDEYYFYHNSRYKSIENSLRRACEEASTNKEFKGSLQLGILRTMP